MYAVEITTLQGPEISRFFETIKAARNWARWSQKLSAGRWSVRILKGGPGGMPVK